MKIDYLTLFPEMFSGVLQSSILKRAHDLGAFSYQLIDFRDFTTNKHNKVDDYPYGGGAGMVLQPQPIFDAVESITTEGNNPRVILMCPQGETLTQQKAEELAEEDHLIIICGHYEGYDERIRTELITDEISIGDYVLTGGELGAMVVTDSVVRLLPGVLGNEKSAVEDSFSTHLLEHPHYTRPSDFRGHKVPDVLLSGNHQKIDEWRTYESLKRTYERRPELINEEKLSVKEKELFQQVKNEINLASED
ncbi:tRNA (guanosine(37)-N1)-methyltransferase TrmD [Halalkalibacillus sediminis]|uniref:tRNA (guanine-N(1)-)-methyltransferase n=1 Tax=Halalkalibacillus sediminis TaxID=2018042 RepID=A0A2I0QWB7_9BACI|nr:tRNA (guanosine(37)-N1)-methyltransferase TrmD [Halalkalibacillus sediminis]PKR78599.1 tRNA (guanosine(37)-N1)-methyltransferase TrmD [Halalkalibacillus sediminis]